MNGLTKAQRNYDLSLPIDDRTDAQIERDAAERAAKKPVDYTYSPELWARVTAARIQTQGESK